MTKITPLRRSRANITAYDPNEAFITPAVIQRLTAMGLDLPDLRAIRHDRRHRIISELHKQDVDAVLLFDPINIRYATDSSNMQVWTSHNLARAALVCTDGHTVLWDFTHCEHMTGHLDYIDEIRSAAGAFYFEHGDQVDAQARAFCFEVIDLLQTRGLTGRIGLDRMDFNIAKTFLTSDLTFIDGQAVMEQARVIKSAEEVKAMRCAVACCEQAMSVMEKAMKPGMAEVELWSILHQQNIAQGGEWIETRILSSGPRTNPWMSEASGRIMEAGELMAFDTDLIGTFGICVDTSRTWLIGDGDPTSEQIDLYRLAYEHIETNTSLLAPGVSMRALSFGGHTLPDIYQDQKYCVKMHGVGLCDEFPSIYYPDHYVEGAFDYALKAGMVMCVEAYVGKVGGREGVKLENQVLVTETGFETLTTYPYDKRLLGL